MAQCFTFPLTLIFATQNINKVSEVREILPEEITIKTPIELGYTDEIPENGETFYENAKEKAEFLYKQFSYAIFAEDSGLEIEPLNGRPGVYSARYAGETKNNQENINKVIKEMEQQSIRKANFKTVICLIINNEKYFFEGTIYGSIAYEQRGDNGFGYDSIFIPTNEQRTFAEMTAQEKNTFSHRAKAIKKMIQFLLS